MSAKPGRNDPCYCGSGKKYKRCHLAEDEAREREQAAIRDEAAPDSVLRPPARDDDMLPVLPPSRPSPAIRPEVQALNRRWQAFQDASLGERVALFRDEAMAGDRPGSLAFDMLDELHGELADEGERPRFRELVELLRERAPRLYAQDRIWYLSWLIEDAVAEGEDERLPALVAPLAGVAEESIDELLRLIDLLMFHDQVEPLIEMMSRAWPSILESNVVLPATIAEFALLLTMLILYRHLDRGGAPRVDDPALQAELAPIAVVDEHQLQQFLDALTGATLRQWTADDFVHDVVDGGADRNQDAIQAPEAEPAGGGLDAGGTGLDLDLDDAAASGVDRALREHLVLLTMEWAGILHRERGIPFSRIEVAREPLLHLLLDLPAERGGRARLLPGKQVVDTRLASLMSFLSGQYYRAGALFALLPSYIDMIAERGLAKRDTARRARRDILTLRPQVEELVADATHDPALIAAVAGAGD